MPSEQQSPQMDIFRGAEAERSPFDIEKLSDKFRRRNTGWSIPEAYLAILISAGLADGNLHPQEAEEIRNVVARSRALSSLSPAELSSANTVVNERLQKRPEALEEACHTLPTDMCLSVFAHAADLILADGALTKSEADFLERLARCMDIADDSVQRILEVLLLKAQY
ncbi:MAG: tellurite resistance TerB family protein [Alphaproteobacteria bacterium]